MTNNKVKLDEELAITGYSTRWVLEKLDEHCEDYVKAKGEKKVVDIEAHDISAGKGYLSRVFLTTVTFEDLSQFSLAMKVPTYDILEQTVVRIEGMEEVGTENFKRQVLESHNNECNTITLISSFKDFPTPKVYYVERSDEGHKSGLESREAPGVIMMNFLDGISLGIVKTVTNQQCINFARDFATLHDYIAQCPEEKWKEKFDCKIHLDEAMLKMNFAAFPRLEKEFPEISNIINILLNFDWSRYSTYAFKTRPAELNAWTFIHGDAWTNNVMYKKNPDGSVGDEALAYIDYQVGFEGSPLTDIAYFFAMSADGDVRREVEPIALRAYYDRLTVLFEKRGAKVPYSFENVQELYELAFFQEAVQLPSMLSLLEDQNIRTLNKEVVEAQAAKVALRCKFNILDAEKIYKKRNLAKIFCPIAES